MSIHDGHRKRVRERFLKEGLENFQPHEILEFLLFYANARSDTNATEHRLINRFCSLAKVFDAPLSELMKVEGVGEIAAVLIKLIPPISSKYMMAKNSDYEEKPVCSLSEMKEFLLTLFIDKMVEHVYIILFDSALRPVDHILISKGSVNTASIGIITLLTFSIPFSTPNNTIIAVKAINKKLIIDSIKAVKSI